MRKMIDVSTASNEALQALAAENARPLQDSARRLQAIADLLSSSRR